MFAHAVPDTKIPAMARYGRPLRRWERREVIQEAACDSRLRGFTLRVLIEIDYHYNEAAGDAFPSQEHIAEALLGEDNKAGRRAVRRAIDELVEYGYVKKRRQGRKTIYALREPAFSHHEGEYGPPVRRNSHSSESESGTSMCHVEEAEVVPIGHTGVPEIGHTDAPLTRLTEPGKEPSSPSSPPLASLATETPSTQTPAGPPKAGAAATKSGRLIDALRERGIQVAMRPQDHKALKDATNVEPEDVAEAFAAIYSGEWGDEKTQLHLTVQNAIGKVNGYKAWKANPYAFKRADNGGPKAGTQTDW